MATIWNYTVVFFQMVLVPCIAVPENWKYCSRVDVWLIPEVQRGAEIYLDPSSIYSEEREYLQTINKER